MRIRTPRLDLIAASVEVLEAELRNRDDVARVLGLRVPASWPPPLYDQQAVQWTLDRVREDPGYYVWGFRYFVLRGNDQGARVAVGAGGYKGPPTRDGTVEIGYSILPEFQRRGLATEAARGLVMHAFESDRVERVIAETLPGLWPSLGVLEKVGLRFVGKGSEEGVVRYQITRLDMEGPGTVQPT
jgi:RimJ/RimL family protein N-acetyltransferase